MRINFEKDSTKVYEELATKLPTEAQLEKKKHDEGIEKSIKNENVQLWKDTLNGITHDMTYKSHEDFMEAVRRFAS